MANMWLTVVLSMVVPSLAMAQERPGVGVDSRGAAVIDPTKNVEDSIKAEGRRQDELRVAAEKMFEAKIVASRELSEMRSKFDKELLKVTADKLESDARLRAEYNATIAATEKARVDAIRLVDTGAVAIANERATATANTLAKTVTDTAQALSTQVTRNAEDLRLLVKTTADEQTRNLQQQFTAVQNQFTSISTRVTALEQSGAEGLGKQKQQDPALSELMREVRSLKESRTDLAGINTGRGDVIGWIAAAIMGLIMIIGVFATIMKSKTV